MCKYSRCDVCDWPKEKVRFVEVVVAPGEFESRNAKTFSLSVCADCATENGKW